MVGRGGNPPRRLDQQRTYAPTGTQAGSAAGIIRARIVIVSGSGVSGVFVYAAGTVPGLGNPPIVSITNGTTDPYGNVVAPGLDVTEGSITGTTISGSTFEGTDFIINSAGAFFYAGTPAAGNLIASIAATSGTDTEGNAYQAGFTSYTSGGGLLVNVLAGTITFNDTLSAEALTQLGEMLLIHAGSTAASPILAINSPAADSNATHSSLWMTGYSSLGGSSPVQVGLFAGFGNFTEVPVQFILCGSLAFGSISGGVPTPGGASVAVDGSGNLQLTPETGESTIVNSNLGVDVVYLAPESAPGTPAGTYTAALFSGGGQLKYVSGDSNAYNTGRLTEFTTGQLANSTSAATVAGLSFAVAAGATYRWTAEIFVNAGATAAGTTIWRFSGPSATSILTSVTCTDFNSCNTATAFGVSMAGPNLVNGGVYRIMLTGVATFTASGTLIAQCLCTANADTYTILAGGFMDLYPVS